VFKRFNHVNHVFKNVLMLLTPVASPGAEGRHGRGQPTLKFIQCNELTYELYIHLFFLNRDEKNGQPQRPMSSKEENKDAFDYCFCSFVHL